MSDSPEAAAQLAGAWRSHRAYVVNLAYQMLGDIGEAEDIAQEAYLRLSTANPTAIDDVRAWLTVVTGRLCLDQVRSARVRREFPGLTETTEAMDARPALNQPDEIGPADRVTLDDQVSAALLRMLQRLSPGERVAFVLHDVFGVPFDAIADTVGRPTGTCRQLARRARIKIDTAREHIEVTGAEHHRVTERFIAACANGDLQALTEVLDPQVWGVGTVLTGPSGPTPPPQVNHGRHEVATNLLLYLGAGATLVSSPAGGPVLLAYARRRLFAVIALTVRDGLVLAIEATADPVARGLPPQQ